MCLFAYWTSSSNMSTKWNIHGKTVPPLVSLASWLEIIPLCALVCVCVHLCRNYSSPTKMVEKKITHGLKQCKTMIYIPNKYLSKINGSPPFFFGFFSTLSTCSPCSSTTNILFNSYKCRECRRIMNMNIQEVQAESARENVFISLQISSSSRCCWAQLFSHFACISLDFVKWIYAKIITWHWPISGKKLSYVSTEKRQNRMVIRNYEHISCFFFRLNRNCFHFIFGLSLQKKAHNPLRFVDSNDFVCNMWNSQILNLFNNYQAREKKCKIIIIIKFQLYIHDWWCILYYIIMRVNFWETHN